MMTPARSKDFPQTVETEDLLQKITILKMDDVPRKVAKVSFSHDTSNECTSESNSFGNNTNCIRTDTKHTGCGESLR